MIWFFTPYSFKKRLFDAMEQYMQLVSDENDWVCFLDGDTAFLIQDFGHQIQTYIDKYPDTGLFTCYASRCHYSVQVRKGTEINNPDILYHRDQCEIIYKELHGQIKEINRRVAGHLLVMRKGTWMQIRNEVLQMVQKQDKRILGVDTKIINAILKAGLKIRLMRGLYIFHYLRMKEGINYNKHLK